MASRGFADRVANRVLQRNGPEEVKALRKTLRQSEEELETLRHILALTLLASGDALLPRIDRAAAGNPRRSDPPTGLLNHLRKELLYLRGKRWDLPFACVLAQTGYQHDEQFARFEADLWEVVEQSADNSDSEDSDA